MYELNPGASATTSTSSFVHSAEAVTFTPLKRTETSDIAFKIETLATLTTELAYDLPENLTRKASLAKLMIKEGKCTIQEVVEFAEVCCRRKLKQPLLDILLDLKLDDDTDANEVAQLLRIMGSTELYPATIFDWIYERIDRLDCRGMSTFLYECGRHGLRCKHFADRAVPRAAKMVPDMSVEEVMRTTQGLIRFIRDWRAFFDAARPVYQDNLANLNDDDWILVLRLSKELVQKREFRRLQELAATAKDPACLPLSTVARALMRVEKHRTYKMGRSVEVFVDLCAATLHDRRAELKTIAASEAIDALDAFSSWVEGSASMTKAGQRKAMAKVTPELLDALGDHLTNKIMEIKYSPNVWLWARVTQAFSRFYHYHDGWMNEIALLARDKFILDKISFFQQQSFLVALARLGFVDPESYQCIGTALLKEKDLFKEPAHLSPVMWAFTTVNEVHTPLFDFCAEKLVEWANDSGANSVIQGLYCLVATGYHRTHDLTPLFKACFVPARMENDSFRRRLNTIREVIKADLNMDLPAIEFSQQHPSHFAESVAAMIPGATIAPTYGPGTLVLLRPSENYGMICSDDAPLKNNKAPMDIILQGRILAQQGYRLAPPLFRRSETYEKFGENYVKYWASKA